MPRVAACNAPRKGNVMTHQRTSRTWIVLPMAVGWVAACAFGQTVTESAVLEPLPLPPEYWFGQSVAVDGDLIVVGADNLDEFDGDPGSAYVFKRGADGQWAQDAHLQPDDGQPFDEFGESAGVSGDTILVGAPYVDDQANNAGAVYVFARDGAGQWQQQDKLEVSGTFIPQHFGWSLAIDGTRAIMGTTSSAAFIFQADSGGPWTQRAMLTAPSQTFGRAVDVAGNRAVVGATGDDEMGIGAGAAWVFVSNPSGGWAIEAKLTAPDGDVLDAFGCSVSIGGTLVVVGSCNDDDHGYNTGSAYVFERVGGVWELASKLLACDAADDFGHSVALSGQRAVVGAHGAGAEDGTYVFEPVAPGGAWVQAAKLTASQSALTQGLAVAATAPLAVATDPGMDWALVYDLDELPPRCASDVVCDGATDMQDLIALLSDWGPCPGCLTDLNLDGQVDVLDLLALLASFGPCDA